MVVVMGWSVVLPVYKEPRSDHRSNTCLHGMLVSLWNSRTHAEPPLHVCLQQGPTSDNAPAAACHQHGGYHNRGAVGQDEADNPPPPQSGVFLHHTPAHSMSFRY